MSAHIIDVECRISRFRLCDTGALMQRPGRCTREKTIPRFLVFCHGSGNLEPQTPGVVKKMKCLAPSVCLWLRSSASGAVRACHGWRSGAWERGEEALLRELPTSLTRLLFVGHNVSEVGLVSAALPQKRHDERIGVQARARFVSMTQARTCDECSGRRGSLETYGST